MAPPSEKGEEAEALPLSIKAIYVMGILLGMDYVFTASAAPNYFTRIDRNEAFDMQDSDPTKRANTQFSNSATVWASGQFLGSVSDVASNSPQPEA